MINQEVIKKVGAGLVFLMMGGIWAVLPALAAPVEKNKAPAKAASGSAKSSKTVKSVKPQKPAAPPEPVMFQGEPVFALVNGKAITVREYREKVVETKSKRFYHGKIPEGQEAVVNKEVAEALVERALLVIEAERRGIRPDMARFEEVIARNDQILADNPEWKSRREILVPRIKTLLIEDSLVEQLEKAVRNVPSPTPGETRAYYDKRPELFTEPEKPSLSLIQLNVDSGAPRETWDQARVETQRIYERIKGGADFADEARRYSQHESASKGGNMGYVHGGMMPQALESKLAEMEIGGVTEPMTVLQGVAIFRLDERIPAKLQDFALVEKRAQDLLKREWGDEAWRYTLNQVHTGAKVEILAPDLVKEK